MLLLTMFMTAIGALPDCRAQLNAETFSGNSDKNGATHSSDSPPPNQTVQNRRINQYGPPAADTPQPAGKPVENPQCTMARANLQVLATNKGSIQQDTDGDGKPDTVLDDAGRESQRNLAEAAVTAYCTSAGT